MQIKTEENSIENTPQPEYYYSKNHQAIKLVLASNLSMGAKVMVFYLISRAGGKRYCWPSQKTISKDIGVSERQVRNLLRELLNRKVIFWKRGSLNPKTNRAAKSNEYDLSRLMIGRLDDFSERTEDEYERKMEDENE